MDVMFEVMFDPLTVLKVVGVWSENIRIFLGSLHQSSVFLVNLRKFSGNVRRRSCGSWTTFGESADIIVKWSENFRKSSKTSFSLCLYDKQCHFSILTVIPSWISFPRLALCHFLSRKLEVETNSFSFSFTSLSSFRSLKFKFSINNKLKFV